MEMRRPKKLQIFTGILVSFLIYGLIGYGLLPVIIKPIQSEPFSFTLSQKVPLPDGESHPVSLPLWQDNESNIAFAQGVTIITSNRLPTKSPGNFGSALYCCHHNTNSSHAIISLQSIDTFDTVFKFEDGQTYLYLHLDIPPPHASASR